MCSRISGLESCVNTLKLGVSIRRGYFMREIFRREIRREKVRYKAPFYTTIRFQIKNTEMKMIFIKKDKFSTLNDKRYYMPGGILLLPLVIYL